MHELLWYLFNDRWPAWGLPMASRLMGWRHRAAVGRNLRGDRPGRGDSQPAAQGGGERRGESPAEGGSARIPSAPLAFAAVEGCPGSERGGEHQGGEEVIDVDAEPPPPGGTLPVCCGRCRGRAMSFGVMGTALIFLNFG